ncbi:hypothetical protein [Polluticaenibacter yanchengensis]|uniref:Uncharacterized protein n=1 Tax=Polluticaenibacter yanchengensis TaxID=3014562 RepID=A0ABT4UFX0_9BACT|nr:hypothetical protein [Chitinophagaceae bacterium LY-5]
MTNIQPEDLILYCYNELVGERKIIAEIELGKSWALQQKMKVLEESINVLNKNIKSPSIRSLQSVLNYAGKKSEVEY